MCVNTFKFEIMDEKKRLGVQAADGVGHVVRPIDFVRPSELSDEELYKKCQEYGRSARMWTRRFAGLLPEVAKRRLYRRKGFTSIHYFANLVGGLSDYTVDKILNLAEKLKDKPALLSLLESGAQGWSKIEKVAYVATVENDKKLAEKVGILSSRSLEVFVQNYRLQFTPGSDTQNNSTIRQSSILDRGSSGGASTSMGGPAQPQEQLRFSCPVSPEVGLNLRILKQHFEKTTKESLTWDQVLTNALEKIDLKKPALNFKKCPACKKNKASVQICEACARELVAEEAAEKVEKAAGEIIQKDVGTNDPAMASGDATRHIPIEVRRFLELKYGKKCAFPGCNKPWENFHHIKRFALVKNHDEKFIVPLCKEHHDLAHAGLIANENDPVEKWFVNMEVKREISVEKVDQKVCKAKNGTK